MHPQSDRPFKILSCPIPGLLEDDLLREDFANYNLDHGEDGSVIRQSLDSHQS